MAFVAQHNLDATQHSPTAVVWLDESAASDPGVAGAKAANLATAAVRGLPIVDGFVITVDDTRRHPDEPSAAVRDAWERLTGFGAVSLVVRSSSTVEDLDGGSMAGLFTSVVDVRGWKSFTDAYRQVVASASGEDMAVLVQRLLRPTLGGVLFGVDPVSGRRDRMVIAAVTGGPHRLVGGEVEGRRTVVTPTGRVESSDGDATPVLSRRQRRRLMRLAVDAQAVFGGPQDIEWAIDDGRALLLQSRPVTATAEVGVGSLLGQASVAETFPDPLARLEVDLWTPPLRAAIAETLTLTGSAGRRQIAASPVLTVVEGYAVVDLELIGVAGRRSRLVEAIDPRRPLRRLAAAWRVGRLRGALPVLAESVIDRVDRQLADVPDLRTLGDDELLRILTNAGSALRALHGHEMLVGSLLPAHGSSAAGVALDSIARGRARGWTDEDIIARSPEVLAVVTPSLGRRAPLPKVRERPEWTAETVATRERLRLRVRWMHELTRRVVRELASRLVRRGVLADVDAVARLTLADLTAAVAGAAVTVPDEDLQVHTPVPARFRLSASGRVVSETGGGDRPGVGASGGRTTGTVVFRDPDPGDVLVVHTLDPALAPLLAVVGGVIAETGSPLSHLAILARERHVPVVVGYEGARDLFPAGSTVTLDGTTGEVALAGSVEAA